LIKLCATGYEINQEETLRARRGVCIRSVHIAAAQSRHPSLDPVDRARSGVNFGKLASVDPLAGSDEGLGEAAARAPLEALELIRFVG
jgi:endonuclease G